MIDDLAEAFEQLGDPRGLWIAYGQVQNPVIIRSINGSTDRRGRRYVDGGASFHTDSYEHVALAAEYRHWYPVYMEAIYNN